MSQFDELSLSVLLFYLFYVFLALWAEPASYRSTGPHQTVGECNVTTYVHTPLGMVRERGGTGRASLGED